MDSDGSDGSIQRVRSFWPFSPSLTLGCLLGRAKRFTSKDFQAAPPNQRGKGEGEVTVNNLLLSGQRSRLLTMEPKLSSSRPFEEFLIRKANKLPFLLLTLKLISHLSKGC